MLDDEAELRRLGYAQQLKRGMSAFGNFALSFSVISILTGAVSLYGYGLRLGGPIEMTVGWPLVSLMTLFVAVSLAELASAYPTAGALYHWASILGGPRVGWWTAWLNLIGQVAVLAGVDYAFADFLREALGIADDGWHLHLLGIYALVLVSHGLLNHVGIRLVTALNELSAWYHLAGTAVLVGALVIWAPLQPASFLLRRFVAPDAHGVLHPFAYACLVGLLQAQWTFTGYDASAHVAEETKGAQEAAPRGIVNAVWVSGVVGFVMLVFVTLAIGDLDAAGRAGDGPFAFVVRAALGSRLGGALVWMVIGAMWFCGLSSVTSNSRMLFAFARDGGAPLSSQLARVGDRYRTPAVAIWVTVATAFVLALWSRAYSVIVSISTIGFYVSYGIPIFLALRARRAGRLGRGPWHIGRWSTAANTVAIVWIAFTTRALRPAAEPAHRLHLWRRARAPRHLLFRVGAHALRRTAGVEIDARDCYPYAHGGFVIAHILEQLGMWIQGVILSLGYVGVMLLMAIESACMPLPSEIIMPFAGSITVAAIAAEHAHAPLNLWLVALAGAIGCNLGSIPAYFVGAFLGRPFLERTRWVRFFVTPHELERVDGWFARRGAVMVFVARLLPVVRTFIALPAGIARMNQARFHLYTFLGSLAVVPRSRLRRRQARRELGGAAPVLPQVRLRPRHRHHHRRRLVHPLAHPRLPDADEPLARDSSSKTCGRCSSERRSDHGPPATRDPCAR